MILIFNTHSHHKLHTYYQFDGYTTNIDNLRWWICHTETYFLAKKVSFERDYIIIVKSTFPSDRFEII